MGKTMPNQPRLVFKQLKGFQAIDEQGKVKTILFLNAAREVVAIIGECRKCFLIYSFFITIEVNCKQNYGQMQVIKIFD